MQNDIPLLVNEDQIDLREVVRALWNGRKLIVALSSFFAVLCLVIALILPDRYASASVLAPVTPEASGLPGALSRLGSVASLAGLSFGVGDGSEAQIAQEIMESWGFIEEFIEKNNLQIPLYAVSGWDKSTNSLIIDSDIYDEKNKKWLIEDANGDLGAPSSWKLYKRFSDMLSVSQDSEAGLVTLSIEHYSPYVAKQLVDLLFEEINRHMQQRKLNKVNSNIEYLRAQVEKTSISHMENVFYTIIEEQIKNKMLAEATPENTFVVVNQSMVAEEKIGPRRVLIVVLGSFFAVIFSMLVVLVRHSLRVSSKSNI